MVWDVNKKPVGQAEGMPTTVPPPSICENSHGLLQLLVVAGQNRQQGLNSRFINSGRPLVSCGVGYRVREREPEIRRKKKGPEVKEKMASVWRSMVVLMVVAMASAIGRVGAQQQVQDCITNLIPSLTGCLEAVQSPTTQPSAECCKGVSNVVKNQMKCLCALYNSPSTVLSYGINMTRVLEIPGLCKVPADISVCKTGGSPAPSTSNATIPAPSPGSSSAPPPTSGSDKQKNGALRLTWSLKPLLALGLLWTSLIMLP